jgi:hypothetical protein
MANFIKGERVSIKYPNKPRQKQTLTISHSEIFNNEIYWYVQERMCAIPQSILIKK